MFDIIAERAVRLCDTEVNVVSRFDGTLLQLAALYNVTPEGVEAVRLVYRCYRSESRWGHHKVAVRHPHLI